MLRKSLAIFLVLVLIMAYIPVASGLENENQGVSKTRYIIGLNQSSNAGVINLIKAVGGQPKHQFVEMKVLSADLPEAAIEGLMKNPQIAYIRPAVIVHTTEDTLDWGVDRIDADQVWSNYTGAGVKVAIVDTGIDMDHPDLSNNIVGGWNIINGNTDFDDDNSHGTHCAGIVAAEDNGFGVVGVAPEADLYGVKVLDANGSGTSDDVAAGILWAADAGVDIISMSLGSDSSMPLVEAACNQAYSDGVLVVAAAGNDYKNIRKDTVDYPGQYASVMAVAATDQSDSRAYFSSTGPDVEIAAPGYQIYSTVIGGYGTKSGTSMATPMVAGVAALVKEAEPSYSNVQIRARLNDTTEVLSGESELEVGNGLVDAEAAVGNVDPPVVNIPPTVNMSSPADGTVVVGSIELQASASDADGNVVEVTFFVDGTEVGQDLDSPYAVSWDSTTVADGSVNIYAVATDNEGASTQSDSVQVTIDNVVDPPVGELTSIVTYSFWHHPVKDYGNVEATVTVTDGQNTVAGVTVTGDWLYNGSVVGSESGVTGDNGTVLFSQSKVSDPEGYTFEVTALIP